MHHHHHLEEAEQQQKQVQPHACQNKKERLERIHPTLAFKQLLNLKYESSKSVLKHLQSLYIQINVNFWWSKSWRFNKVEIGVPAVSFNTRS